jgi:hypothetical protein
MLETLGKPVDYRDNVVAFGHGQASARAKIVLHVDDEQQVVRSGLYHWGPRLTLGSLAQNHGPASRHRSIGPTSSISMAFASVGLRHFLT